MLRSWWICIMLENIQSYRTPIRLCDVAKGFFPFTGFVTLSHCCLIPGQRGPAVSKSNHLPIPNQSCCSPLIWHVQPWHSASSWWLRSDCHSFSAAPLPGVDISIIGYVCWHVHPTPPPPPHTEEIKERKKERKNWKKKNLNVWRSSWLSFRKAPFGHPLAHQQESFYGSVRRRFKAFKSCLIVAIVSASASSHAMRMNSCEPIVCAMLCLPAPHLPALGRPRWASSLSNSLSSVFLSSPFTRPLSRVVSILLTRPACNVNFFTVHISLSRLPSHIIWGYSEASVSLFTIHIVLE